jgi:hypothetical protein
MTCRDMEEVMISSALAPDAAEHVAGCKRCRHLLRVFDQSPQASPPSAGQMKRIEAAILRSLAPVQPLASPPAFFSAFALVILTMVVLGSLLLGTDGWRALNIFQRMAVFSPLAACACLLVLSLVQLMAPGSEHIISPTRLSIGVLPLLALIIATLFPSQEESSFVSVGLMCLRTGFSCAIPAAVLFWLLLRRGAILSVGLTGAIAGGLAGLVGLIVLEVRCPNLNGYHILVWHWGVALLAMLSGLALGRLSNRRT